jgi:hypothetical protein
VFQAQKRADRPADVIARRPPVPRLVLSRTASHLLSLSYAGCVILLDSLSQLSVQG